MNEIKSRISPHYSISTRYCLWVKLNEHDFVLIEEGTKEELEKIPHEQIEKDIIRVWQLREHKERFLDEIQNRYPKKFVCEENLNEIAVYNKNGKEFKRFEIPKI